MVALGVALVLNITRQMLRMIEGYELRRQIQERNEAKTPEQLALEASEAALKEQDKDEVKTLAEVAAETQEIEAAVARKLAVAGISLTDQATVADASEAPPPPPPAGGADGDDEDRTVLNPAFPWSKVVSELVANCPAKDTAQVRGPLPPAPAPVWMGTRRRFHMNCRVIVCSVCASINVCVCVLICFCVCVCV